MFKNYISRSEYVIQKFLVPSGIRTPDPRYPDQMSSYSKPSSVDCLGSNFVLIYILRLWRIQPGGLLEYDLGGDVPLRLEK